MSDEQIRTSLSAAIMNMPCITPDTVPLNAPNEVRAYMTGHRDARHAAAEIASAAERQPLTDAQRMAMWKSTEFRGSGGQIDWFIEGTRAAERAHKIGGAP